MTTVNQTNAFCASFASANHELSSRTTQLCSSNDALNGYLAGDSKSNHRLGLRSTRCGKLELNGYHLGTTWALLEDQRGRCPDMSAWRFQRRTRLLAIASVLLLLLYFLLRTSEEPPLPPPLPYRPELFALIANSTFKGFDNESGAQELIVPNIVHFLYFGIVELRFVDAVCLLAAYHNQKPDVIMMHTDNPEKKFTGRYWDKLQTVPGLVLQVKYVSLPQEIFGQQLSRKHLRWHASDITRIRILMEYGGIFLDNDSYLVKCLDRFRKFEMALGWPENAFMGTQVLVAHKDARFLHLWLETYREYYPDRWYYNAGEKPTRELLQHQPELVHRVKLLFGVHDLSQQLYASREWPEWREYYAIHLLIRLRWSKDMWYCMLMPTFTDENIHNYPKIFGEMARIAYFS